MLDYLIDSLNGPVGKQMARAGLEIAELARENASGPIIGMRSHDLVDGIRVLAGIDSRGVFVSVGSSAVHRGFAYPGYHDQHGRPWLRDAFDRVFRAGAHI